MAGRGPSARLGPLPGKDRRPLPPAPLRPQAGPSPKAGLSSVRSWSRSTIRGNPLPVRPGQWREPGHPEPDDLRPATGAMGAAACCIYSAIRPHAGPEIRPRSVTGAGQRLVRKYPPICAPASVHWDAVGAAPNRLICAPIPSLPRVGLVSRSCVLTELRRVFAAQRTRRAQPQAWLAPGMSCSAGVDTTESGYLIQVTYLLLGAACWHQPQPTRNVRTAAVTCDDTRTLKFTLIVQRMPMSGRPAVAAIGGDPRPNQRGGCRSNVASRRARSRLLRPAYRRSSHTAPLGRQESLHLVDAAGASAAMRTESRGFSSLQRRSRSRRQALSCSRRRVRSCRSQRSCELLRSP